MSIRMYIIAETMVERRWRPSDFKWNDGWRASYRTNLLRPFVSAGLPSELAPETAGKIEELREGCSQWWHASIDKLMDSKHCKAHISCLTTCENAQYLQYHETELVHIYEDDVYADAFGNRFTPLDIVLPTQSGFLDFFEQLERFASECSDGGRLIFFFG